MLYVLLFTCIYFENFLFFLVVLFTLNLKDEPEYIFLATLINTGLVWYEKKKILVNIYPINTVTVLRFFWNLRYSSTG